MIRPKRVMTSFDVASVVKEFESIVGKRVANVYALPGGFLFKLRGEEAKIVAVPGERIHLTRYDISEKGFPPPLIMGLRKYLRGARVASVGQLGFDRVVRLTFDDGNELYNVYVEVLPRGVMVLADSKNIILHASDLRQMRDRVIRRGVEYQSPPGRLLHPSELSGEEMRSILKDVEGEAVRVLVRKLGYPGEAVEEALIRAGLTPTAPIKEVYKAADELAEFFQKLYEEAVAGKGWILYDPNSGPVTVVTFEPRGLREHYGYSAKGYGSASEALDEYFVHELKRIEEAMHASSVASEREKLLHSIKRARHNLEELRKKLESIDKLIRAIGENIGAVYEALECARRKHRESGWEYIVGNCPGVIDVNPSEGKVIVSVGQLAVPVDIRLSPDRLLVELSRKRGEMEAKIRRGEEALRSLEEKLKHLEEETQRLTMRGRAMVRRKEWYEKYHWLVTSNGFLAIGGRDASQNESVVKRYLNDKRIFMHADIHGAPIVIVFTEGEHPPERDLRDAALLTAAYSKAWKSGLSSVDAYWVWGSQVSKSAPAGEYLAKGAFMVYGKRNYIRGIELRLGIGVGVEEEAPLVIIGPPDLVKRRAAVYAVLVPGDEDPSKLAKRLKRLLAAKARDEHRPIVEAVKVEELILRLPGRSRVIHVGRGEAAEPPRPIKRLFGEEAGAA